MANWVEEFNQWLKSKNETLTEFSRQSKIPKSSLTDYLYGRSKMPDNRREKFYMLTGLEVFKAQVEPIKRDKEIPEINEDILSIAIRDLESQVEYLKQVVKLRDKKPAREERRQNIRDAKKSFYNLIDALDYFKHCPDEERQQLTRAIDGRDVGYLTSFLDAIYKPDVFRTWVNFSNYRVRGKDDQS